MTTPILHIDLVGLPPSINHTYGSARNSARFLNADAKKFRDYATSFIRTAMNGNLPYTGKVGVEIRFFTNNRRRWDIDNRVKLLLDCLMKGGCITDDSNVDYLLLTRLYSSTLRTCLMVFPLEE